MVTYKISVLVILDSWSINTKTPVYSSLSKRYPASTLVTSAETVGLPKGQICTSEACHYNLGSGSIVPQDITRVDQSITDGSFFQIPTLDNLCEYVKKHNSSVHLVSLLSDSLTNVSLNHLFATLQSLKNHRLENAYLHLITDGCDTPPTSAQTYLTNISNFIKEKNFGQINSIIGRFYAMDKDRNWLRTQQAYELLVSGKGRQSPNPLDAISNAYKNKETDEFIAPSIISSPDSPFQPLSDNDGIIFVNFRGELMYQLVSALTQMTFRSFTRENFPHDLYTVTMLPYTQELPVTDTLFPSIQTDEPLSKVISGSGLAQLHLSESLTFRQVTQVFNGGADNPIEGEDWIEVPSHKAPALNQPPEMRAREVTEILVERIHSDKYNFIVANYPNNKVHQKAKIIIDQCLGKVVPAVIREGGLLLITSCSGGENTLVPFLAVAKDLENNQQIKLQNGIMADVAPSVLASLGIHKPNNMTGKNLLGA
ncbi:2,3-bisphosphoglycerate-independent phosphoglycerate mutase [Patescibacteria group bacterium]|nr:2,3-bisphosphoglycerate-independent phosphoglycerate mutase [Patescibacteria group bacterium]